jgi:hypothetical protein
MAANINISVRYVGSHCVLDPVIRDSKILPNIFSHFFPEDENVMSSDYEKGLKY